MAVEHIEAHEAHHPGPRQYVVIGAILAVLTAFEVWAFFWNFTPALVISVLLTLSSLKFALVVGYFMHLRFDDRRFLLLFVFPFVIMVSIAVALLAMFLNLTR